jgi:hypothetical protein
MTECSYCGESVESEAAELQHLRDEHADELSRIDRRRVGDIEDEDGGLPTGPIIIAGVVLIALAVVVYVTVFVGGGSASEPGPVGSAHEHGTMEMVVLGEEVDFSQGQYQVVVERFHFENNDGEVWHTHATGARIAWELPPGWGPAVLYGGGLVRLALIPYKLAGYAALAYLVYATVLDTAGSAVSGVVGLFSCVSCTWPIVGTVVSGIFGGTSAIAAVATSESYGLSTLVFVSAVGLLYYRPSFGSRRSSE